jgi:ATP synthase protein I
MEENNINEGGKPKKARANIIKELAPYSTLGIQLVLTILLGAWVGWMLDGRFNTKPIFLIILTFLGAIAGMVSFIKTAVKKGIKRKIK